jgi:hypothetical protein
MKNELDKNKFLEILRELPITSVACKRAGIHKSVIYRWRKKNKKFATEMDLALVSGRDNINDLAESHVINNIRNGDTKMVKFWLENNCGRYTKPRPINYFNNMFDAKKKDEKDMIIFKVIKGKDEDITDIEDSKSVTDKP